MSVFKDQWMKESIEKFKLIFPDEPEKKLRKFLEERFDEEFKDSECIMNNNYEKTEYNTTLSNMIDWMDKVKPSICENGSFYRKHSESYNPVVDILQDKLNSRGVEKKKKFEWLKKADVEVDPELKSQYEENAKATDLAQGRLKVIANSEYGISLMASSFSFNVTTGTATTIKGQVLISTAFNAFEDFLEDAVKFLDMDDCITFINNIIKEKSKRAKSDDKWIKDIDKLQLYDRLFNKFLDSEKCNEWQLVSIINGLSQEDKNRIYYKCNLYEFLRNSEKAMQLLINIIQCPKPYMEPTKPPKGINKYIVKLNEALLEYVHYNYPLHNRVLRLKTAKRRVTITIDTDSNFINLGPWKNFVYDEVLKGYVRIKRRKVKDGYFIIGNRNKEKGFEQKRDEQELFRIINTMAYVLGNMIDNTLKKYLKTCNVEDDAPGITAMKNEFFYDKILTTPAKKHYQALIRLQEGTYFETAKLDVKGMEYLKPSNAGEDARTFVRKLVERDILGVKGIPVIPKILKKIAKFEDSISESIKSGEFKYLKTAKVKTEDAYSDPMGTGSYKAVYVWNELYPDKQIELPGAVYLLKVDLNKPKDFAQLSVSDPEMFDKLMKLFKDNDRISKSGITNIAIPLEEKIPEWIFPYIKIDEIIQQNTRLITPILQCLGLKTISKTKSSTFFSNIIEI